MKLNSQKISRRGFTLIEVLAAMLLMSIVLPVAMRGAMLAQAAAAHAKHLNEATTLAESKLNELIAIDPSAVAGQSGDFSPDHPEYLWKCQGTQRDYDTTELSFVVSWQERGQEREVILSTLVYSNPSGVVGAGATQ